MFMLMQEEWKLADDICNQILAAPGPTDWDRLMEPFPFFTAFKNYLQVRCALREIVMLPGCFTWNQVYKPCPGCAAF